MRIHARDATGANVIKKLSKPSGGLSPTNGRDRDSYDDLGSLCRQFHKDITGSAA
jgi:hypothetical protein